MAGVLTPGGYVSQNQFIFGTVHAVRFVCEESTGCGLACAAVFGTTEKPVTGRRVRIDTHTVEPNRDPEEVPCEALRVPLPYVRETPELGHWHEVLRGILHRPEKSQDASLLPAQELSTSTHIHASDQP